MERHAVPVAQAGETGGFDRTDDFADEPMLLSAGVPTYRTVCSNYIHRANGVPFETIRAHEVDDFARVIPVVQDAGHIAQEHVILAVGPDDFGHPVGIGLHSLSELSSLDYFHKSCSRKEAHIAKITFLFDLSYLFAATGVLETL